MSNELAYPCPVCDQSMNESANVTLEFVKPLLVHTGQCAAILQKASDTFKELVTYVVAHTPRDLVNVDFRSEFELWCIKRQNGWFAVEWRSWKNKSLSTHFPAGKASGRASYSGVGSPRGTGANRVGVEEGGAQPRIPGGRASDLSTHSLWDVIAVLAEWAHSCVVVTCAEVTSSA